MQVLYNVLLFAVICSTLVKTYGGGHNRQSNERPLRVAVNILPPFSILMNYTTTKAKYHLVPKSQITGFEVEIFDILLTSENFKANYYARVANEDMYYGTIYENGTTTGMFYDLQTGKIDAIIGYIKDFEFLHTYFDVSKAWNFDDLQYCMPKEYENCQWTIIWSMFSPVLPLILSIWVVQQIFLHWLLQGSCPSFGNVLVTIVKLFTGNATKVPKNRYPRLAALLWIVFQTFFTAIIQSVWTLHLSNPKTGYILVPTSINYLFENNLKLYYNPYDRKYFLNQSLQVLNNSENCFGLDQCLTAVEKNPISYVILSKALVLHRLGTPQTASFGHDWRCFSDEQIKSANFFVFQKNNSLTKAINKKLLPFISSGINLAQIAKFTKPKPDSRKEIIGRVLRMKNMRPTFYFLGFGLICSFCCFIIECVVFLIKRGY